MRGLGAGCGNQPHPFRIQEGISQHVSVVPRALTRDPNQRDGRG
jgi:hypothetical protein